MAMVTHILKLTCVEYRDTIFMRLALKNVQKLQLLQNAISIQLTKACYGSPYGMTASLAIHFQVQFKVLVMADKFLNHLGPGYQ